MANKVGTNILIDMAGQRFGRLVVVSRVADSRPIRWLCKCDCGVEKEVRGASLRLGATVSCDCRRRDFFKKHGLCRTPVWAAWANMKSRCGNEKDPKYPSYGGRGIAVCDRWLSFDNFLADMGEPPPGLTLDRIDNDGNYEPANCAWRSLVEQGNNRRDNRIIECFGNRLTLTQWSRKTGIKINAIRHRLSLGWTPEVALTSPVGRWIVR